MKRFAFILFLLAGAGLAWAQGGVKQKRPLPSDYGRVTLNNFSSKAGMAPVVFDHWVHRKVYTCRLCHVDVGFAMAAGETKIHAADNMAGHYCGTCHNGMTSETGRPVFESCAKEYSRDDYKRCVRCHVLEPAAQKSEEFQKFVSSLPKEMFGNGINWEKAEKDGKIKAVDYLEGISIPRKKMKVPQDFDLSTKVDGMPDIVFSHSKHTVWNGCELCHPEIFVSVKKGSMKYSMNEIFEGKYCGVCHGKVAFPMIDCQRCHSKPVGG